MFITSVDLFGSGLEPVGMGILIFIRSCAFVLSIGAYYVFLWKTWETICGKKKIIRGVVVDEDPNGPIPQPGIPAAVGASS
jgi:hypothetical protein